ncbi:primosomal protein N' [Lentilactobacillus senioris]|uniref:primosomal protein N' n=1 Tax=Lentilactobacillus senioris TaxID=931534 RepID=UPI003D2C0895
MPIAQVIVDVPTSQTNTPYSYGISDQLLDIIQVGMRVLVPFGRRQVVGFVVKLTDNQTFSGKLKNIIAPVDLQPVLNKELLQLARWMAEDTYSFLISCLQTIIPGGMRTKAKKFLTVTDEAVLGDNVDIFQGHAQIEYVAKELDKSQLKRISSLIQQGLVSEHYSLSNHAHQLTQTAIKAAKSEVELTKIQDELPNNAKAQWRLLELLKQGTETILQTEAANHKITGSTIKLAEQKGWLTKIQVAKNRNPFTSAVTKSQPLTLNPEQANAVQTINASIDRGSNQTFLLEGVTGSGKTEVYLQIIANALQQGKTAMLLVPEITLTPQIVGRIRSRFGEQVAMMHSSMSVGERFDEWRRIESGAAKVVVGVRSAVFVPLDNIGVIIMDEEHDSSYKQEENPRYQTRDVAKWRGAYHNCPVVLGSATPSLETRARAGKGVYQRLVLAHRINDQALPEVEIVDMKQEIAGGPDSDLSASLLTAIEMKLQRHEQIILMLNRRGYSSFVLCRNCGFVPKCPNCDISLTYHKDLGQLKCHYCGFTRPMPRKCDQCGSTKLRQLGMGSQKLEETVNRLFPTARVLRMDVDTTRKKGAHERIIKQFSEQQADILVGTQMIAKGLDFPNVTLVGVLNADTGLEFPDFRSSERTFELLTQVAGRAGRADKAGQVIIQTFNPDHYAILLAQTQNYEEFYRTEMKVRHAGKYPPYYFTVKITLSAENEKQVVAQSFAVLNQLQQRLSPNAVILGPTPKVIKRINRRYYYQIIIKYRQEPTLSTTLTELLNQAQQKSKSGIQIGIDNEPMDFM